MANKARGSSSDTHSSAAVEYHGLVSVPKYPRVVEHFLGLMWREASRQPWETWTCVGAGTKGLVFAHKWGKQRYLLHLSQHFFFWFLQEICVCSWCVLSPSTVPWGSSQLPHSRTGMNTAGLSPPRFPAGWTVPHHIADLQDFWTKSLAPSRERAWWVARHEWRSQVRQGCY